MTARSDIDLENFCSTPEKLRRIPAGYIREVGNPKLWITGGGEKLTAAQWKAEFGTDPEELWGEIEAYRKAHKKYPGQYRR